MEGEFLKEIIKNKGIELSEVAKTLGMSPQSLQSKLRAKDISVSFLLDISNAINKSVYDIINEKIDENTAHIPPSTPPKTGKNLSKKHEALPPEQGFDPEFDPFLTQNPSETPDFNKNPNVPISIDLPALERIIALKDQLIASLHDQLTAKDHVIISKDEVIASLYRENARLAQSSTDTANKKKAAS